MKNAIRGLVACAVAVTGVALTGCGKDDPNKNLKPIDPNTKPPKIASEGAGGAPGPNEKPAGVLK
jgi:predicted small lipoprotein YifL